MRVTSLAVRDWRNLAEAELWTDARFVVLHGDNAQGKTNLLEAVWVLATLRSWREPRPRRWIRAGAEVARLRARVVGPDGTRRLQWRVHGDQRRLEIDGVAVSGLSTWFALLRAVLFVPEHQAIVRGEPAERRDFVDRAAFTARPDYLDLARDYGRVVRQKTALLRGGGRPAELDPWDRRLVELGARVQEARARVVEELRAPLQEVHAAIAGGAPEAGRVGMRMRGLGEDLPDRAAREACLAEAVARARPEELRRGRVLVGPHRDDLELLLEGRPARAFASQGQARSLVLSLKLAELAAARARGQAPMFLLDDLSSELDRGRMARLVELLAGLPNQVWVTTTDPAHLGPLPGGEAARWRVAGGQVFGETVRPAGAEGPPPGREGPSHR